MMTSNQILNFYKFIREIHSNFNDKIDQTEVITTRLKSHQLNAVNWMLHKDKTGILTKNDLSMFRGGIPAEDVGIGKTLKMLCCIMAHPTSSQFGPIFLTPRIQKYLPFLTKKIFDHEPMNAALQLPKEMSIHVQLNKPKMLKIEMGFDNNPFVVSCFCYSTPANSLLVVCALCGKSQQSVCVNFKPKPLEDNLYLCPSCWNLNDKIDCKASLIIVPMTIMSQWINEMEKHTSKPRNVFMYGGVCSGGYIKPTAFNDYDIVITSYNQLEENLKAIRNPYSKDVITNLTCVHKWAITGTPILSSEKDFDLITKVMELNKYYNTFVNNSSMLPFHVTERKFLWISYLMWRNSTINDNTELSVQKPTIEYNWLTFSDIEKQCYSTQQNEIIEEVTHIVKNLNLNMEAQLNTFDEKKLFNLVSLQLLKLRQACIHPQNTQGELVKLADAMSMDNLADFMIERAGDECNEILYPIISHHDEMAQAYIENNNNNLAIDQYKIILDLIQKHENKNLKVDACQKMRTMYNLDTLLDKIRVSDDDDDVYAANGLKNLKIEMVKFEKENLDIHVQNVDVAQKKVEVYLIKIAVLIKNKTLCTTDWWPDMATIFSLPENFLAKADVKWEEYRAFGIPNIGTRFRSVEDVYETLEFWSMQLNKTRDELLVCIKLLINTPIDGLARAAMLCHAAEKSNFGLLEKRCLVCRTRVSLGAYKKLLFSFSDKEENIPLDTLIKNKKNDKDVWTMSLNEFLLILLLEHGQAKTKNKKYLIEAANYVKVLKLIREEYEHLLQLWSYICDNISTHIDINLQAKSISFDDMIKPKGSQSSTAMRKSKKHPSQRNERTTVMEASNLNFKLKSLEYKINADQSILKRNYGIFHYLENFKNQEEHILKNEPCTICALVKDGLWAVLRCGHKLCQPCLFQLQNNALVITRTICPICRDHSSAKTICYGKRYVENQECSVKIKGSFSTKVESITAKLLELIGQDPTVKVLIFSNWEQSLHLVGEALKKNSINHRILLPGKEYQKTVNAFKNNMGLNVLLLKLGKVSEGLDLTMATTIFFIEPAINKEENDEVIDRVLKLGQTKPIFVHYFIFRDSIETTIENTLSRLPNWDNLTLSQLVTFYKT